MKNCHDAADEFFEEICKFKYTNYMKVQMEWRSPWTGVRGDSRRGEWWCFFDMGSGGLVVR
jgi:hypothetical protein